MRSGDGALAQLPSPGGPIRGRIEAAVANWPTPDAFVSNDGEGPATFLARQARQKAREINGNGMGLPLAMAAKVWPTPTASDCKGPDPLNRRSPTDDDLPTRVERWPTPTARDYRSIHAGAETHDRNSRPLSEVVGAWPTPQARDGDGRGADAKRLTQPGRHGGYNLDDWAAKWATPSVADVMGGHLTRSGARKSEPLLNGQAKAHSSHLDPTTSPPGRSSPNAHLSAFLRYRATTCSASRSERRALLLMAIRRRDRAKPGEIRRLQRGWTRKAPTAFVRPSFRRSLNPRFVGDLMGWPPGLTSFACSETASSTWRARMRSALSQLTSHAAPPAQLSLFG
jgi:hypothetical protein